MIQFSVAAFDMKFESFCSISYFWKLIAKELEVTKLGTKDKTCATCVVLC